MKASSKRSNNLEGTVTCPGDKSISQRSVIIGSLLDKDIQISGFLFAEDPLSTIGALRNLGNEIEIDEKMVIKDQTDEAQLRPMINIGFYF